VRKLRACVLVLMAAGPLVSAAADSPRGHLILIGGGDKPRPVMAKFVELSGGPKASILIVPTASELPDTGDYYKETLAADHGCTNVTPLKLATREDAQSESIVTLISSAGGIFFSGGDQSRITKTLLGTPVGDAIAAAYGRGAVIGGTSAGTACMSTPMITGNGNFDVVQQGSVELVEGLGLFPHAILDQHFVQRRRQNRLFTVVLEHKELIGVGIDEETAVWLKPDQTFEVLGESCVMVLDATSAKICERDTADGTPLIGAHDMRVHVLLPGDAYDLRTRKVLTLSPAPQPAAASH